MNESNLDLEPWPHDDQGSPNVEARRSIYLARSSRPTTYALSCPTCRGVCNDHTKHNLTVCPRCRHVFQTDLRVTVAYDARYAHQYDNRPVKAMSELRWRFIQSCLGLPAGSRVLDVGYGNGAFLKHARDAGMEIYGIDLHSEDFGIPVVDFDTSIDFDLICFFDSLEHFPHFRPIVNLRSRYVIVSIPNAPDCLLSAPETWRHYKPGEHLHYFSHDSLRVFLHSWGFTRRLTEGYPEDALRGKLSLDGQTIDNIYTAIYART